MKAKKILILFLFFLAFLLRARLTTLINKGDILAIEEWSRSLYQKGVSGSYFREGWVYSSPTQPPLMMLLYWLSRWLYENKYFLAITHNIFRFPPASVILWLDKNGPLFFVRLWGILADCFNAALVYWVIKKIFKKTNAAFWAMVFLLFNPLTIFDGSVWGQVDLLSSLFAFASFFSFYQKKLGKIISPLLFTAGVFLKPTVLVLAPLYLFFLLREFWLASKKEKKEFFWVIVGLVLSLELALALFIPFWDKSEPFFKYLNSILTRRIVPSAKGVSKVATSAHTFFTVFFDIDKTLGSQQISFFTLEQLGNFLFLLINCLAIGFLFKRKEGRFQEVFNLTFLGYFVAEGTFVFKTGMAERYFFPAFLFIYVFYFLIDDVKIKTAIIFQFILWFINLTSSFYLSDFAILDTIFRQNNYLGTRIISSFNVLTYLYIVAKYLKMKLPLKKVYKE